MFLSCWALLAALGVTAPGSAADQPRPNVVFIYADDWGWGDLSSHGHPWLKTPHLDRLAREGTDFHQFNVLNPVCSPSRAAAMTGRYPARFNIHQHFAPGLNAERGMPDWLDPKAVNLAHLLKAAGYRTAHFGKWHLTNQGVADAPAPAAYGFDEAAVFNSSLPAADMHATGDNAARFIRENKGRPFYLNVWLHETHLPHLPTEPALQQHAGLTPQQRIYAAVVTDGDNTVGQVMNALREAGVDQNTLVIFSSDNGPENTGPESARDNLRGNYYSVGSTGGLKGRKRSLFEGGVRVPFLVRWPGRVPAGRIDDRSVITAVDLLPTVCAATGVALPPAYRGDGENVLAAFTGRTFERSQPIFWEWRGPGQVPHTWPRLAVREGSWKLYLDPAQNRAELYDVVQDRGETNDLASARPEVVSRLRERVLAWKASLPASPDPSCISATRGEAAPAPKRAKKAK